jgi:membrane-associated phospholipid phosphatase
MVKFPSGGSRRPGFPVLLCVGCLLWGLSAPGTLRAEEAGPGPARLNLAVFSPAALGASLDTRPGPRFSLAESILSSRADRDGGGYLSRSIAPWTGLGTNALGMFAGSRALLHLSAVAGTVLIVLTGLDTQAHDFFVRNTFWDRFASPSVGIGTNFPIYLGAGVLGAGLIGGSSRLVSAGGAVLQASLLALCYTTTLKALTGRPGPDSGVIYDDNEASRTWRFGFLRGGVFHGWPSGHMLANTAAVTSLLAFYPRSTWLKIVGGAYLGYLWIGVASHHGSAMHWLSDTVAGILMGCAIGSTVGHDFRERWERKSGAPAGLSVSVMPRELSFSYAIPFR